MAGSINGYNPNAVGVPVSKYIANATHSGALQDTGKKSTKVEAEKIPEPVVEAKVETPVAPPQEDAPELPGVSLQQQADGSQQLRTDSGVNMSTDKDGKISNIEVPGDGSIQRQPDGQMMLQTPDGQKVPVHPFESEDGGFAGYSYTRKDETQVHVNLENMSVGYISKDNNVWQEVQADGSQLIRCKSDFKDPKTGERKQLDSTVFVHTDGSIESNGYNRDLQVSAGKIQYKSPANFTHTLELPQRIPSLAGPEESKPQTPAATNPQAGPLLMEEPGEKPVAHCVLPNQVGFDRDETGQTAIMLRSGLTLIHTNDSTAVRDPKVNDHLLPAEVENYKSADGRLEKAFKFKDSDGNQYRMFNESMDFLVDSPDGKVRQHVLPGGTILGQIQGENGKFYRFEVTPGGEVKADTGLNIPPSAADKATAYIPGPDGKPVGVALPYPIPNDQANAAQYANVYGTYNYPQSGEVLEAFQNGQAPPPQAPPQGMPPQPPIQGGPPQPPIQGGPPNQPPYPGPGVGAPPIPSMPSYGYDPNATVMPYPGVPQQPVQPGFMQRLKYMFTGNPSDIQPRMYNSPPPPWMGSYPGSYGYPNGGYPTNNSQIYDPSAMVPQSPMGSYYGEDPMAAYGQPGQQPPGQQPPGQPPIGSVPGAPSYPGQVQPGPNYAGQTPTYPGQMPNAGTMLDRMKADFDRSSQAMWGQVAMGQATTNAMIMGQSMNSMFSGLSLSMAMWPRSSFFCPFMF